MASKSFPVAVIGMAVRVPGALSCDEFWHLLIDGKDTVKEFPSARANDISHVVKSFQGKLLDEDNPFFTGSFFDEVDKFDADVFQIHPGEAKFIEPEQRFFLETTWELLEDAGYASKIKGSRTGVYVGNTVNKYKYILTENHPSISHGNHSPFIASRISYTHDLQGPAMMIATGCSSSLLAVHVACQGLLSGDCDMAIAGGITLDLLPISSKTDIWNQLGITGPNVKCRAFDESANGIAKGEGCGVVLLKPLAKALENGDFIYGVLEATTANQDGHSNGITAPHPVAQANMLNQAWKLAEVSPKDLDYFEAHGTGTALGDPIEISGITNAFKKNGIIFPNKERKKIPIGSVKANIGHLADGAAGVVSLIKTLLCINRNKIPAAVNFTTPNSHINWDKAPVYINQSTIDWVPRADESPRLASVSAFGLLGTNVHVVVREHIGVHVLDSLPMDTKEVSVQILALSANSNSSLLSFVGKLITYFKTSDDTTYAMLKNVCYTINTGREHSRFKFRAIVCGESWHSMLSCLEQIQSSQIANSDPVSKVWCKTDQGSEQNHFLDTEVKETAALFLQGNDVDWKEFCLFRDGVKKVPFLPTYAYEGKRFWPNVGNALNTELLRLQHQLQQSDVKWERFNLQNNKEGKDCLVPNLKSHQINEIIAKSLNAVLDANIKWGDQQHTNLLTVGLDSLMFTQVCMMIRVETGCTISMTEFHQNPTFLGLKTLIERTLNQINLFENRCQSQTHSFKKEDIPSFLEDILNSVLGKELSWKDDLQNENLFALGIDSLLSTHINMKLVDVFGVNVKFSMVDLHKNATFAGLCDLIANCVRDAHDTVMCKTGLTPIETQFDLSTKKLFPVSFAQRRLWVMQEMTSNSCAYNATNCIKITGNFHHAAFVTSANTVLSRHCAFFTEFVENAAGLMQRHTPCNYKLEEVYCLRESAETAEASFTQLYNEDYKTPFDLRHGPLVRCKLYKLPDEVHYFTMVIHHIIFDGWSHFVFYNELWDTYRKICEGQKVDSTPQRPLYVEFSEEEQRNMLSSSYKTDLAYWKNKLSGDLPHTTFPGDKRRPAIFTYNGGRITHFLSNDAMISLHQFSADRCTMFMTLLAAVYVLIYQYTGDKDLIIGTPVAGRLDLKYKNVIGCFINTLCLRVQLKETFNFKDVLEVVANMCLEANEHQRTPFDHLVSQLNLPRNTGVTPVFSINVCYHNTEAKASHIDPPSDISVERRLIHNNSSKWDMQFDFLQEKEGMRFTLEYCSDIYSKTYAETVVEKFLNLLEAVCNKPSTPIVDLLQSNVNRANNVVACRDRSLIHGIVRDIGSVALPEQLLKSLLNSANDSMVYNTDQIAKSHGSLMNMAEKLAVFLRERCRNPKQSRIGILLDNSVQALESILACMFSGLVYVPMDPASPKPRLEHICTDAAMRTVIFSKTHAALANHLQWACSPVKTIICIDSQQINSVEDSSQATLMDTELWDCVASEAKNDIEGGGWKSSYTGEYMSKEEMMEYSENILTKIEKYLKRDTNVLEIGCASGLTTNAIRPLVKYYVATDLSQTMVEKLRNVYKGENNIDVHCTPADKVDEVCKEQKFDVIIMNSVVHCFPGHNYLRKVISVCRKLLSDEGVIFIGDIMDLDCRDKLVASLKSFQESRPTHRVKTQWHNELFLSREFLQHLCETFLPTMTVSFSRKIHKIPNELTEFRFDAIFSKAVKGEQMGNRSSYRVCSISDIEQAFGSNNSNVQRTLHSLVKVWCSDIDLKDEAYVLYTSGTTGTPKGVIIAHEALLNYVSWACRTYALDKKTCMPLFSPLTFDFTVTSIFPPLLAGSSIRIFKSFQDSYQEIASCKHLTTIKVSPLQLDTLLSISTESITASTFVLGGEELTSNLLSKLKKNKSTEKFVVWNEYGPTEATVGCIVKKITSDILPLHNSALVPIGKPIDNVTVEVLGNTLKPVPVGGRGILCIGGKSICSGFTGNNCSSVRAACWGRPGNRMLVTDDIAEMLPTSREVVYFGRKESDSSKVNGIRMALVEIQEAIETSHLVDSAWVSTFVFETKTYLGAAVKLKSIGPSTVAQSSWKRELISSISHVIPTRSIPAIFVSVTNPPTNANGKKDTKLLKRLFASEMKTKSQLRDGMNSNASPECSMITKLQEIWQSVLPINHLPGKSENFFYDLSGDSLQAIHLTRKMRAEGFKVSVADIFQNPTIEQLLPVISKDVQETSKQEDVVDERVTEFRPTPTIEEFLSRDQTCPDHFSLSALLKFHANLDIEILRSALRSVMKKHGSLRSRFRLSGGKAVQCLAPLLPNEPKMIEVVIRGSEDSLTTESEFVDVCNELERHHSLSKGILVACALINFHGKSCQEQTNEDVYVLLAIHHIATDIVSWQQILEDLALALKCLSENSATESILTKPSSSFEKYCSTLHAEALRNFVCDIPYWIAIGKECEISGTLVDGDRQSKFDSAKWEHKAVDAHMLRSVSSKLGCSDEHVLLTVFGRALSIAHGHDKTAICLESHGRQLHNVDSTDTVGWFTSRFPLVLNTPITGNLIKQVNEVEKSIKEMPNRGLSFGVLKSAGELNIRNPKIMFVFQGSLDASTKAVFDGGDFKFEHVPWLDVMKDELIKGRFHRHPEEMLEFDLEIITWIHGGKLQLGCLFDEKTLGRQVVHGIVNNAARLIERLAKRVHDNPIEVSVAIFPAFNITPECVATIKDSLQYHDVLVNNIELHSPEQMIQSIFNLGVCESEILVVIPRHKTEPQANEFVEVFNNIKRKMTDKKVILIDTDNIPNTASLKVRSLIETDAVFQTSEIISSRYYDHTSDERYQMPFTRAGYTHFGLAIARAINAVIGKRIYKVIAVDADYTLWEGECAQGQVVINSDNIALQEYLLKQKERGMLLVILSKNNEDDIDNVFDQQGPQMTLKQSDFVTILANWESKSSNIRRTANMLNIGLESFVFIDDNALECEEMLQTYPNVLTLQLPIGNSGLIVPLINNLWSLDEIHLTSESRERTELYRREFLRQKELQTLQNDDSSPGKLSDLLQKWKMKLTLCKCTVESVKKSKALNARVVELLQRTNQFKLNNVNLVLDEMNPESQCWLIGLSDIHGSYGIVSVCIFSDATDSGLVVTQWVVSCRALGRHVEQRIITELYRHATENNSEARICMDVNKTSRNTPMLDFLKVLTDGDCQILSEVQRLDLKSVFFEWNFDKLHTTEYSRTLEEFQKKWCPKIEHKVDGHRKHDNLLLPSIDELTEWVDGSWTTLQKDQATYHNLYPIIPKCSQLHRNSRTERTDYINHRENMLREAWMEVLQQQNEPQEHNNFFECGGNSFKAVFLVSKLRRECRIEVNIIDILQNPVYGKIRAVIQQAQPINDRMLQSSAFCKNSFPLSSAQQRMMILQQARPKSTAYVETVVCYSTKRVEPTEIIKTLTKEHPMLTSKIHMADDNKYTMTVTGETSPDIASETLDRNDNATEYLTNSIPVINVISCPLYKFRHLITATKESLFVLHVHHVIVDDVTLRILAEDLHAIVNGDLMKSKLCSHHYSEYVNEEKLYYNSAQYDADRMFWKRKFLNLPSVSTLAIQPLSDNIQNSTATCKASNRAWYLQKGTMVEITKYCRVLEVTEFQYFLACASLVLQRYLGVGDFVIAIPVTTRSDLYGEVDGLFINTVLFRVKVNMDQTLQGFVKYISDEWLKTLCHFRYPLDHVAMSVWKENGRSLDTFCSVMFNFTTQHQHENGLRIGSKHAKMPFCIDIIYDEKTKTCKLISEWAEGLIDSGIAERLSDAVVRLSSKGYEIPQKLCEAEVLSPDELQLLESLNVRDDYAEACLLNAAHEEFEDHVASDSTATAIFFNGKDTSYGRLNSMSSRIANFLWENVSEKVLKRDPVVIVMKKDHYAIASILGIWKAGGYFLPIALSNETCLKDVLERGTPAALLYNVQTAAIKSLSESCPVWSVDNILKLSHDEQVIKKKELRNWKGSDTAYVIRTSGSTGRPKQCKISHQSLRTIAAAWKKKYAMSEFVINVLQWAPLSFDVFIGDVVRALVCVQGKLIICPDDRRLDIPYIRSLIRDQYATIFETTPQFGFQIINQCTATDFDSIRIFILGSDVLQEHLYNQIKCQLMSHQRLINSYGMTEATIDSSFFEGDVVPSTRGGTVPIGKPLPGVKMHILDSKTLQPCPVGTIGELYISGNILATGDVELVQMNHCQKKALKTGDAACWLPTGDIELMGRLDNMVKLRGFRISTTEIENKIVGLIPGVKEAHVSPMIDDNMEGLEYLWAYLVLEDGFEHENDITHQRVCSKLRSEIPYYMLPDKIHIIQEIPLTSHGKVNKNALPKILPDPTVTCCKQQIRPNSETTLKLKQWFAEALGLRHHDLVIDDATFMEQGGHSLILLRFWSLITSQSTFKVEIADLFSYPTICSLAEFIQREDDTGPCVHDYQTQSPLKDANTFCNDTDIAITGIGLRLPGGVMSLAELCKVLQEGNDLIANFPEKRTTDVLGCLYQSESSRLLNTESFEGAFLSEIDKFDHGFFRIAPGEAKFMSPEQRLFLQVATEALAEGNSLSKVRGSKVGVFVGSSEVGYAKLDHPDSAICVSGLMPGMIATRVAYQWDLKGPTMLIDTACSSSLVALKQACESIRRNECIGALVGGVNIVLYPSRTGVFGGTSILSPDFHCKAFDRAATGTAVGEGVLCLYVEPLSIALKMGKPVYAVVKGVASNSVGHGNGITAPSSSSQVKVIQEALDAAHLSPADITFVEGHGTGTNLGDRIELSALSTVFSKRKRTEPLPVGAIKNTFGHLDSAAGLLGVFKVLACMVSKKILPTANFNSPHPELTNSPLYVPASVVNWETDNDGTRAAGVSSYGLTGTNCHAILVEDKSSLICDDEQCQLNTSFPLLFIGDTLDHLKKQAALYKVYLEQMVIRQEVCSIQGLCLTVAQRINEFQKIGDNQNSWRMVVHAKSTSQLLNILDTIANCEDTDHILRLSSMRSDIHLQTSYHNVQVESTTEIQQFLEEGRVDISRLFNDKHSAIKPALGVNIAFFKESRHWLDTSLSQGIRTTCEGNLLELFDYKVSNVREMVRSLQLLPTKDLEQMQRMFCTSIIINLFLCTDLAKKLRSREEMSFEEAFSSTRMLEKYRKLFFVMIRELLANDMLEAVGNDEPRCYLDRIKFKCEDFLDSDTEVIATSAISKYPQWADCFRFPLYCSKHLHKVLLGEMSPLSVIYPQGDLNFMYQFDKLGDLLGDVYYNMYMQLIAEYAQQLSRKGKQVRVLEVGAGVGHVTRQLLPKLKCTPNIEYWFTDLGKAFVEHAKTMFSEYLYMMKFSTFDITRSAPKQGLLGSFDIVISYNVIHTTQSIKDSVMNLKSCLGEDGTLFIIESARNDTWATLAWGILDGWWYFEDYDLRPTDPMLEPEKWEQVLSEVGFDSVYSCPQDEKERHNVEKFLFLCSTARLQYVPHDINSLQGWWEINTTRFNPIKTYDEIEEQNRDAQDNGSTSMFDKKNIFQELRAIWCDLLGVNEINADDDFNTLGGESLLAIQMMNLVRKRIGYQLEIADTFGYPTLNTLANFIADQIQEEIKTDCIKNESILIEVSKKQEVITKRNEEVCCLTTNITDRTSVESASKQVGTLLMFPGQGAQKQGMCISMKDSPEARQIFDRAKQVLGYDLFDIFMSNDDTLARKLKSTEFVQISLFVSSIAKIEQIKTERPNLLAKVTHVAGLSVGEFAALVYAGVINFEDALCLVQERGRAMELEVQKSPTGMVSVFGLRCEVLENHLLRFFPRMRISTYLADNQHTVAGNDSECKSLEQSLLNEFKEEVVDVRKLRVAGAFHSIYMSDASKVIDPMIERTQFCKPTLPVIMNANGDLVQDSREIKLFLCDQLVSPVQWKKSIITAYQNGVRDFVEVAPARVLASIVKNRISQCADCNVELIII